MHACEAGGRLSAVAAFKRVALKPATKCGKWWRMRGFAVSQLHNSAMPRFCLCHYASLYACVNVIIEFSELFAGCC